MAFYQDFAARCDASCRVPRHLASEGSDAEFRILLEDLDGAGFSGRRRDPRGNELDLCIAWLANFHGTFVGEELEGLWPTGTYWHLATRPDELAALPDEAGRRGAHRIDERLRAARYPTLVHGDAKPDNFCFGTAGHSVAAVDFQYVGGGCGMKDLAYLCSSRLDRSWEATAAQHLDTYFGHLRASLARHGKADAADAVEAEGRALYGLACADFHRFLAGWTPNRWSVEAYQEALEHPAVRRGLDG